MNTPHPNEFVELTALPFYAAIDAIHQATPEYRNAAYQAYWGFGIPGWNAFSMVRAVDSPGWHAFSMVRAVDTLVHWRR